ncbi:hypothetical protein [Bacillus toyonensis]|uniref:hypothetical protein n=1 Tax=Bacillus toyonensis TaxID=155322 RepID=UPI0002F82A7F|nr:hypothetical protein [Bacillus toyonensis]PKR92775.1 hypothetical protein bcere0024_01270 [Bacillus cereus Rock4-18]
MVRVLTQPEPGWQRIDDSDRNIIFEGENWISGYSKYSDDYLKTFHYKDSSKPLNSVQIKFSFVGTKLRLIGLANNGGYDSYATIIIDGNPETLDYYAWEGKRQAVIYEKINLNKGPHTVTIRGTYLNLDAIDIDSDGYVFTPKKVGEILDKPDPGWNRFDDADSLIKYGDGAWNRVTDDRYYNSTAVYSLTKSVVEFSFKGTGVRLVSKSVNLGYGPVDITIDGAKESYNPVLGSDNWKVLLYNKEGLKNEFHSVKLEGPEGIIMDAIDILDGELVKTAKVGDVLLQPEIGWKRIDDTNVNIKYSGNWTLIDNLPDYHNSTARFKHAKQSSVDNSAMSATFKFKGTKLRVIGVSNNTYDREAQIIIDGKPETISFYADRDVSPTRVLLFDKQGLTDEMHTVELKGVFMHLDAIDIDETGSMVPPTKVGDVLLQPEAGWKRIDDTDSNIQYTGNWSLIDNQPLAYNSTIRFKNSKTPEPVDNSAMSLTFRFKGTKFRVIGVSNNTYDKDAQIIIDGKPETISFYADRDISPHRTLLFDKQGLTDEIHIVELKGVFMALDAIDIDENGSMVPPAKVGDVLLQPESRWTRFDDRHSLIKYGSGTWELATDSRYYNSTNTFSRVSCDIEFSFKGTGLRIVSKMITSTSGYGPVDVLIDGITEKYSITGSSDQWQTLLYEKQGLPDAVHSVKLVAPKGIIMDAIDVLGGELVKPPAKVGEQLLQPEAGWTRVDDANPIISYIGTDWLLASGDKASKYYNQINKYRVATTSQGSVQFSFKGTGIRIVSTLYHNNEWPDVSVEIDGVPVGNYVQSKDLPNFINQVLLFEKTGLTDSMHSIKLTGTKMNMDAFDILGGDIVKNQPKQLLQPESGWNRINNSDASINAVGFITGTDPSNGLRNCYMNDHIYSKDSGTVTFEFTGTGLRVLGLAYSNYSNNIIIDIDGVKDTFSEDYLIVPEYLQGSMLVYEKLNLKNKKHTVTIHNGDTTKGFGFDAFDIFKPTAKVGDKLTQPEAGWKRIDDTDSNIKYTGLWQGSGSANTGYYNDTMKYKNASVGSGLAVCEFSFTGTKLRVIGAVVSSSQYYKGPVTITIDGIAETYTMNNPNRNDRQVLLYEKLNLSPGNHVVKIEAQENIVDAFDIDSNGSIGKPPATVGDQLFQPEVGWKRIDDTDPNFKYRGTWYQGASSQWYNSTYHYVKDNDSLGTVEFDFYGTQLRIISCVDVPAYRSDDVSITIDGVTEKYSEIGSANIGQVLGYEKLGLTKGKHRVRIQCGTKGTYRLNFDAIDIDPDGYIEWPPYVIGDIVTTPEPGWKRFDDNAPEILYDANWAKNVGYSGAYGGKSTSAHKGKNSSFRFKFKGTKFRLIVGCSTTEFYSDKISVRIDDLPLEFFNANALADTNQVLKYEKLGLEDKEHEVKVKVETSRPGALSYDYRFDALDIDDTGSLIKINTVGDELTEPEKDWKRIDDTDPLIRYIGNWKTAIGNVDHYNKTTHYNLDKTLDTSFEFEFVGTKLRLLAYGDSGYDATSKVLIDGKEETMVYNSPSGNQVIRYEKIGLDSGKHTVKVIGKAMSLDSIDIDADGYLLARLGDKLVEPEPGWVRFDDTHKNIEYNGFWKTTEADVSCYNNTHHWKSKEDNNDSTISARFLFKGTKFRLISMTSPSYPEEIELKIDDQKEILKLSGEGMQYQKFAYEKKNLEDRIHVIELSGKYISIDAIDLEEGATLLKLPDEKLKPYQIRSGLIFKDDFDTFDSRWIASPVGSYSLIDRKGNFRMLHNVSRDTLLLADLPNEKEFAFEVSADYTPTHEDDKGGIIVWKNGEENIEFLETEDGTRETTELKWMACKDSEDWTFFSDYGEGFNFYDSDRMNCSKFGVVLKKGSNSKFINLDIDSIIATRGRKLTIANIAPNISVEMEDEFGRIIFNGNTGYNTGIQITLPSLEFAGKVILKNVEGKELGVIKTTFYGGDVYGFGSNLEIKFSGEELSTLAQTRLPDMISGKSEIMLELVNPSVARANNVNLSIAQYEDKFGWSWADLALDCNGKPGQYQDSIKIPYVDPENTMKFWLKVTKGTDYVGLAPLQFQIHLEHE